MKYLTIFIVVCLTSLQSSLLFADSTLQINFINGFQTSKVNLKSVVTTHMATKNAEDMNSRLYCEVYSIAGWSFRKVVNSTPIHNGVVKLITSFGSCNYRIVEMRLVFKIEDENYKNDIKVFFYPDDNAPKNIDLICNKRAQNQIECVDSDGNDEIKIPINNPEVNIRVTLN